MTAKGTAGEGTAGHPMDAEFDTVAQWTAQVASDLGPEYEIPAACRGSGQPEVLDWLLHRLAPRPGEILVDVRAGVGGPAPSAAGQPAVQPVLVEPAPDACRAAARLFGVPAIQADATDLPLAGGAVTRAWCLGVLCTLPGLAAQQQLLNELRRILDAAGMSTA